MESTPGTSADSMERCRIVCFELLLEEDGGCVLHWKLVGLAKLFGNWLVWQSCLETRWFGKVVWKLDSFVYQVLLFPNKTNRDFVGKSVEDVYASGCPSSPPSGS